MKKVLIYDFGSQYTQLIARRVRELKVYSEIVPPDFPPERFTEEVGAVVLSGGPGSVYDPHPLLPPPQLYRSGRPILGICYGLQAMVHQLGGRVEKAEKREYGLAYLEVRGPSPLFEGLPRRFRVWMSHADKATALPPGFRVLASTENSEYAAVAHLDRRLYAVQFHPEVRHTEHGTEILGNFLFRAAGLKPEWDLGNFLEEKIREIRERVGDGKVVLALSGGVDSSVVAALLARAVPDRFFPIFVDTGLLRKGDREKVVRAFGHLPTLRVVDAADRFFEALQGVTDPEEKRRRIGHLFIEVFREEARKLGPEVRFLAQGTLYPDVIESRSVVGPSAVIKSHHNVGGLPQELPFELIEPLKELFKDEVRALGRLLGLPEEIVSAHPFPGPGLAVRIIGEVTPERVAVLREADAIAMEELKRSGYYDRVWQAFCVLLPVRTVGVMGDRRTYEHVCAFRAVVSEDGMTADWARLPHDLLARIASRIVNEVPGINRVVYDITSKPPGTIEWE